MLTGRSLRSIAGEWGRPPVRVREILTNPSYAGWVVRGGERFEAAPEVARIVDRDTWHAVQDLLADEARRVSPGPQRKHLLSGIARCECGASMRALSIYYKCSADSSHATIYRRDLEPHVKGYLALDLFQEAGKPGEAALGPLAGKLRELEEERDRWTRAAGLPGASFPLIEKELNRVGLEIQAVAAQLAESRVSNHVQRLLRHMADATKDLVEEEDGSVTMDLGAWLEYFDALDLDAQRTLVDNRLTITVTKGRGLDRVRVESRTEAHPGLQGLRVEQRP
ncbi:recombinase family protein [Microbacterium sp. 1.5R]|uniref:recombinase family protein n=1 Tax=Microbacterium sp. 1.5R TaxID=1916917 RepID=UPI003FA5E67F